MPSTRPQMNVPFGIWNPGGNWNPGGHWKRAALLVLFGSILEAAHLQTVLQDSSLAAHLMSQGLWRRIVEGLGGRVAAEGQVLIANIEFLPLFLICGAVAVLAWASGAWWIARRRGIRWQAALTLWGVWGWSWWLIPGIWEAARVLAFVAPSQSLNSLLVNTSEMWQAVMWAGWTATGFSLARPAIDSQSSPPNSVSLPAGNHVPAVVWCAMAAYFATFGLMNWMLYESLLIPHGDSAMYEEHLWNLLHGKGFRSYLDDGRLFLGEHVQVIHLLLIPPYLLWPSHVLLELCQSLALASGAIPVFWIAFRHSSSKRAAILLACAYLLYFPMQFLDIAIDFKTFRPNSFEIPLLLFALDALERCRYRTFLALLFLTLLAQEDAAPVLAPLGIWIALRQPQWHRQASIGADSVQTVGRVERRLRWFGLALALFSAIYLMLVLKVILPFFRAGQDVHFARYFSKFGGSTGEIVQNVLSHPSLLLGELATVETVVYALGLLLPLGFLPLFSPGRLAVAAPLFGVLCLNQIARNPLHHFHAPIVPIVVWAAAAGLGNVPAVWRRVRRRWNRDNKEQATEPQQKQGISKSKFTGTGKLLATSPPAGDAMAAVGAAIPPKRHPPSPSPLPRKALLAKDRGEGYDDPATVFAATWCLTSAAAIGFFISLSPLGLSFWDPDSSGYWRKMYVPGTRAERFPTILALVPADSRVASTDFVHPRFTHFNRSYDYSDYRPNVPADTDYIVIDTQHPYSRVKRPEDVKEYREHPERWELLPDQTGGYFIVLKRVRKQDGSPDPSFAVPKRQDH